MQRVGGREHRLAELLGRNARQRHHERREVLHAALRAGVVERTDERLGHLRIRADDLVREAQEAVPVQAAEQAFERVVRVRLPRRRHRVGGLAIGHQRFSGWGAAWPS
ncbi:hypothetical protein KDX27_09810 [Burkholderia cenocepacia]|nr:hypothetical protein [Burkholderia cenocepacia]